MPKAAPILVARDQLGAGLSDDPSIDCRRASALTVTVTPPASSTLYSFLGQSFTYLHSTDARINVSDYPGGPWQVFTDPRARAYRIESTPRQLDMPMPFRYAKVELLNLRGGSFSQGRGVHVEAVPYNAGGWSAPLPVFGPFDLFGNPVTITGTGSQNIRLAVISTSNVGIAVPTTHTTLILELRLVTWSLASGTVDLFVNAAGPFSLDGFDTICRFAQLTSSSAAGDIYTATIRRTPGSGVAPHTRNEYGLSAGATRDYWGDELGASLTLTSVPAGSSLAFRLQATFLP